MRTPFKRRARKWRLWSACSGTVIVAGKQAILANFIRQNYYKAAFMTVTELAKQVKTSPATVVRFAGALGYAGYPGLKHHLHQVVQDDLTGPISSRSTSRRNNRTSCIRLSARRWRT